MLFSGQMEGFANWYEKRDHLYVETHAFRELHNIVDETHWAALLGKPGDGKSCMAAHLMLIYRKLGFEPVFCSSAQDWKSLVSYGNVGPSSSKQFVIIDNMFGISCVDQCKVGEWLSIVDMMVKIIEERKGSLLVVCTSRRYIFTDVESAFAKFRLFKKFSTVDMTEDVFRLSNEEKMKIFKKYVDEYNLDEYKDLKIGDVDPPHGFPHCVEMFCTNVFFRNNYGLLFFENPVSCVQKELTNFKDNDHIKYLVLVLVLFHNNRLDNEYFQNLLNNASADEQTIFKATGVSSDTCYPDLIKARQALTNTYLKIGADGSYCFTHESMMENVAFIYISTGPTHALETLDFKYILAYINSSYKNVVDTVVPVDQVSADLPVGFIIPLVKRMTKEIKLGNIVAVCSCATWCNGPFVAEWIKYIYSDMRPELKSIFCTRENQAWVWDGNGNIVSLFFHYKSEEKKNIQGCVSIGGTVSFLSALVYLKRKYAVFSILGSSFIQRELKNVSIWKVLLQDALKIACEYSDNADIVTQLLSFKLDGTTALLLALEHGYVDYIDLLIRSTEVKTKYKDCGGRRYLHYLAVSNVKYDDFKKICDMLLENGEDINMKNESGKPHLFALMDAIVKNKHDLQRFNYFLQKGADVNIRDYDRRNLVLHIIKSQSSTDCLQILPELRKSRVDFQAVDARKQNALHYLFRKIPDKDLTALTMYLIKTVGVNMSQKDRNGKVPLMLALQGDSGVQCVEVLLLGSPRRYTDRRGQGYFHYLCSSKAEFERFSSYCLLLLNHREDMNVKDLQGEIPLFKIITRASNSQRWFTINTSFSLKHIQLLTQSGFDIHAKDKYGRNLVLHILLATKVHWEDKNFDPLELLQYCYQAGINFHGVDSYGRNAMHYVYGDYTDPWPRSYESIWCYSWSIAKRSTSDSALEAIAIFLKDTVGVDCYTQDTDGVSSLMLALRYYPDFHNVRDLIRHPIPFQKDINGRSYFHYLARSAAPKETFEEICDALLRNDMDINSVDVSGRSPLFLCADFERIEGLKILVNRGADVNLHDTKGDNLLSYLLKHQFYFHSDRAVRKIILNFLNENGVDYCHQNNDQVSPLMLALQTFPDLSCVKEWVKNALPILKDKKGQSYFHYLARAHTSKSIFSAHCSALLNNEVDINQEDFTGRSPLIECFDAGYLSSFKLLVEFGANIHVEDRQGRNLLLYAFKSNLWWRSRTIVEYLVASGIDCFQKDSEKVNSLMLSLSTSPNPNFNFVKRLLQCQFPLQKDLQGRNYFHYLARSDAFHSQEFMEYCSALQIHGVDINEKDSLGRTPIFECVIRGCLITLKVLVEHGADIHVRDNHGVNLVLLALNEGFGLECKEILKYLRKMGADFQFIDKKGRNAMHYFFMEDVNNSHYHSPGWNPFHNTSDCSENFSYSVPETYSGTDCILRDCSDKLLTDEDITDIYSFLKEPNAVNCFHSDNENINPLMLALENYPYFTCVNELMKSHIPLQVDKQGRNYFHYLVRSTCSKDVFKSISLVLLKNGVDINARDLLGKSPLFECFSLGKCKEMNILVELGATAEPQENWETHPVIAHSLENIKMTLQNAGLCFDNINDEAGWSRNFQYLRIIKKGQV